MAAVSRVVCFASAAARSSWFRKGAGSRVPGSGSLLGTRSLQLGTRFGIQLPIRLGVEEHAADVVASLVQRNRLEELVLRQSGILSNDPRDAVGPSVVRRERQDRGTVELVEETPQVRRAQPRVD